MSKMKKKGLEIKLFEGELIEVEFDNFKDVSIQIGIADQTDYLTPKGALYRLSLYKSGKERVQPFEYDIAWIMKNGTIKVFRLY